ncbi:acetylcholinesterase-like [Haliotis cracherodii]|uniref:acetylcholinesterase-like n=1 Tax=Haliotis cracherodii TaxID=6455 RepID=UPI0039EC091F
MSKCTPPENSLAKWRGMAILPHVTVVIVAWLSVGVISAVHGSEDGPLVGLKQGKYRGNYVTSTKGEYVAEYLGIPYAKPPTGVLRLANPQPLTPHPEEVYHAKTYGAACPQVIDTVFGNFTGATMWNPPGGVMSEDCLYLNVWVPQQNSGQSKTVMVWIYGGGFFSGTASLWLYNGKTMAASNDVIVVSFNYRLGALGFLSSGDDRIPGNFGLMDQVLVLKWIKNNIKTFGGDPNQVTLVGESAGAVSVTYHLLSPLSSGLFQRAIIQSHAGDALVFNDRELARGGAVTFFDRLKCKDNAEILECLRKERFDTFVREQWMPGGICPHKPTISPFMPQLPEVLLRKRGFKKKAVLMGTNKNEATYFMIYRLKSVSINDPVSGQTQQNIKEAIRLFNPDLDEAQCERVFSYYTDNIDEYDLVGNRNAIDALMGDRYFTCPSVNVAESNVAVGGETFYYYYNHRASNEVWPAWMGVMHAAEIQFVFGMPLNNTLGYTAEEMRFSQRIMSYWTNFAKSGNPNGQGNRPWPKYTSSKREFLELVLREKNHDGGHRSEQCRFWSSLLNSSNGSHVSITSVAVLVVVAIFGVRL